MGSVGRGPLGGLQGPVAFRPDPSVPLVPSGQRARVDANIAALRVLRACEAEGRPATPAEQTVLSRWSSWGAVPQVFDDARDEWAADRAVLTDLLTAEQYAVAGSSLRAYLSYLCDEGRMRIEVRENMLYFCTVC